MPLGSSASAYTDLSAYVFRNRISSLAFGARFRIASVDVEMGIKGKTDIFGVL
jgi:hypothetical protein